MDKSKVSMAMFNSYVKLPEVKNLHSELIGGFTPFDEYERQLGLSFPIYGKNMNK